MQAELGQVMTQHVDEQRRRDQLADMLCRVFDRDPHFNWLVRQDTRRREALSRLFQLLLGDMLERAGELHVLAEGRAAAIWYPPGGGHLPFTRQLAFLRDYLPIAGLRALPMKALGLRGMEARRPRQPHYYLQVIAVDTEARGRGLGRALMRPVLRRCDAEGVPAYLETANRDIFGFYAAQGFANTGSYLLPGGPELWQFVRLPRSSACAVGGVMERRA